MRTFLFQRAEGDAARSSIPFEAELYAAAPERFGGWHDSDAPLPAAGPAILTEEQMRGELALLVLRWLCLLALTCTAIGSLVVLWRVAIR